MLTTKKTGEGCRSLSAPGLSSALLGALMLSLAACASHSPDSHPPLSKTQLEQWQAIERAEFARLPTAGLLAMAKDEDAALRERAALALGRMPFPEHGADVTAALLSALEDPSNAVQKNAAFGLGMRRDPNAGEALTRAVFDLERSADVRAVALEAASKLERPDLVDALLEGLNDASPQVRLEAYVAPHRWNFGSVAMPVDPQAQAGMPAPIYNAELVDKAILNALAKETDDSLPWRALFCLQRRSSQVAHDAFLQHAQSEQALEKLFAIKGLARLPEPSADSLHALLQACEDSDWRVAAEALSGLKAEVALRLLEKRELADTLRRSLGNSSNLVAASGFTKARQLEALGVQVFPREAELWEAWIRSNSVEVRQAAAAAYMETFGSASADVFLRDPSAIVRASAASTLVAQVGGRDANGWVDNMLHDSEALVRAATLTALAQADETNELKNVRPLLLEHLQDSDNGLRLAAALALEKFPLSEDLKAFRRCFRSTDGDIASEVKFHLIGAAAKTSDPQAAQLLKTALSDADPFVAKSAQSALEQSFPTAAAQVADAPELRPSARTLDIANKVRVRSHTSPHVNPHVEILTTRGAMLFELFPNEAPQHVANFVALIKQKHYEDLRFHRVVADFVVQGGDYRGDGNGGITVSGIPHRHEISLRKYVTGSLGMPRYDDWDSGGSQIFVAHRPTPHLGGRYTIFGELREGFEILNQIERDDRIRSIRVIR